MLNLPSQPWTLASCVKLGQRDQLAAFWLAAPEDLLPGLWDSPVGEATKSLIKVLSEESVFTAEQVSFRNSIDKGFQMVLILQGLYN